MRTYRVVIMAAAAAAVGLALTSISAEAVPLQDNGYGQVTVNLKSIPRNLSSVRAEGNGCQMLDWKHISGWNNIGLPGNDGHILRTEKGKQLTFQGYTSTDCSGQPASTIVRSFGDPDQVWATGSRYEIPWQSY
jgi:hypothetical protein